MMGNKGNSTSFDSTSIDTDPIETAEWLTALGSLCENAGPERAIFVLQHLEKAARALGVKWHVSLNTPYINTLTVKEQAKFPGNLDIEEKLAAIMRWNALAMVVRANKAYGELGGHIASYASAADLFEVGFNHFFRAGKKSGEDDLIFFQPHSAPGVYARAFLEGRLAEDNLALYRQEITANQTGKQGLCSYPHPWLMPDFWQFPTGSMGLGPISSIYHARFMRYLYHRQLLDTQNRKVWGVFGDGEMDEPESMSALTLAAREKLDNLIWVVNCNLQRLDGPVRGNDRIIDELESLFLGAGWRVIKLIWGSDWDGLFAQDTSNALAKAFSQTVDGQFQTFAAKDGRYNRIHFFGQNPRLEALVSGLTDDQIDKLKRSGHDLVKIHAAYHAAMQSTGQPVVILAHTKKGFGMGTAGQGRMTTHQQKKLETEDLLAFRDRFHLPLTDEETKQLAFYKPDSSSEVMQYLQEKREALGGYLPRRLKKSQHTLNVPNLDSYAQFALMPDGKEMSTTMAFVRLLTGLLKTEPLGSRIVPIVADEARTFGMANLFRQIGIYSSVGQGYEPEDIGSMLSYKEAINGQILEEGISEAGAISSWIAAATSYSVHDFPMLPFYIYYSMFGFQRVGDAIWAAADQRARGFLIGATSGRTTLGGEGLQHQDGSSLVQAASIPNCRAYDPCFAAELAMILNNGMQKMLVEQVDEFYYITVTNENYAQTNLQANAAANIIRGMYLYQTPIQTTPCQVRLLGSGAILHEVIAAANLLEKDWHIAAEVWSVTSFSELAKEARTIERQRLLHPDQIIEDSHVETCLQGQTPIIAATDYIRAWPQLIASYIHAPYIVLGTDGFGRSDNRAQLRAFFEVDRYHITVATLSTLAKQGMIPRKMAQEAILRYPIQIDQLASWLC